MPSPLAPLPFASQAPSAAPQAAPAPSVTTGAATPTELYRAAQLASSVLHEQRDQLMHDRRGVQNELSNAPAGVDKKGLEDRLAGLDARIADVDKQIAAADALVAQRAALPGVVVQEPDRGRDDIPPGAMVISGLAMLMLLLLPVSIAYARRIWRRGATDAAKPSAEQSERLSNMERGIEAVAIEVERLGEGQRFITQLLAEGERRRQMQALPSDREGTAL